MTSTPEPFPGLVSNRIEKGDATMPAVQIRCPACDLDQPVVSDHKRRHEFDLGPISKTLRCGAVALITFSGLVWLNFDNHKKEQPQ